MVLDLVEEQILRDGDDAFDQDNEQDLRIAAALETVPQEDDDTKAFQAWLSHLEAKLSLPFEAQIVETQENRSLKAGAQVTVFDFAGIHNEYGIMVSVKTVRKRFDFPLSNLEVCEETSPNYQLVDDYVVWFYDR